MKLSAVLLFFLFYMGNISAQSSNKSIAGEYYLNGVMETASGFKLNADSSFAFFFSQGALDRYGKGKDRIINDSILFTSDITHSYDFTLVNSSKQPGKNTIIKITDPNANILKYVFINVKSGQNTRGDFA